ncbi:MAG: HD domain-containing protein [Ruminococcus sp.]|jgi:(p)ppGpp synthase/HD superfamily hydrolase
MTEWFDEEAMYRYIKEYSGRNGKEQTLAALDFAREKHKNQIRSGPKRAPYIIHPMGMVCHGLALGITEDEILAAALLHDVCEECDVTPSELPAGEAVREAVSYLTCKIPEEADRKKARAQYMETIKENRIALIVKLLDRCSNVSTMAEAFSRKRLKNYIEETRIHVLPLAAAARIKYPEYGSIVYVLEYHIRSVIDAVEAVMEKR